MSAPKVPDGTDDLDMMPPAPSADGWMPQMNLRFREDDGRRILQQLHVAWVYAGQDENGIAQHRTIHLWRAVPFVEDEIKF